MGLFNEEPQTDPELEELLDFETIPEEPDAERQQLRAWHLIASHPFFLPAFDSEKPLLEAMLEMLDALE